MAETASNAIPVAMVVGKVLSKIHGFVHAAKKVFLLREEFKGFSRMVERLGSILTELNEKNPETMSESLKSSLYSLEEALDRAIELSNTCSSGSVCLILLRSPDILKKINTISDQILYFLDNLSFANLEFSFDTKERVVELRNNMRSAEFKAAVETEEVISKLQNAFQEDHTNSQKVIQVLVEIANITGASMDSSFVRHEIETLRKERMELEERKDQNESHFLEQVIAFLYRSEMVERPLVAARIEPSEAYGHLPSEEVPIKSFCCPLTGLLMEDPVDISSGHTFERRAIEDWFHEGNKTCPVTGLVLKSFDIQPNFILYESIKEWKERVVISKLEKISKQILSLEMPELDEYLNAFLESVHKIREDIVANHVIPDLLQLLRHCKDVSIKTKAITCLSCLASVSSKTKEVIVNNDGITLTVDCLVQDHASARTQGVDLLLELSRERMLCNKIGQTKNCILRLVALTNCEDSSLSTRVHGILMNLSNSPDSMRCMCEANYFRPLIHNITNGSFNDKVQMALLLGSTTLTDYSRTTLIQQNVLPPLVQLLSDSISVANLAALKAIKNIASHSDMRNALLQTDAVKYLLEVMLGREHVDNFLCLELASNILSSLMMDVLDAGNATDATSSISLALVKDKGNVHALILLLATTDAPPSFKANLLYILLALATLHVSSDIVQEMHNGSIVQLLLSLIDETDNAMKVNIFKLMNMLIKDGNERYLVDALEEKHVSKFVSVISDPDVDIVVSVLEILSKLPSSDSRIMGFLMDSGAFLKVVEIISKKDLRPLRERERLIETSLGVFLLFVGSSPPRVYDVLIKFDAVEELVQILDQGRPLAMQRAATALGILSRKTVQLSKPLPRSSSMFARCWGRASNDACGVHNRICSSRECFCLVKGNAIVPLVKSLSEKECNADAAALDALTTLIEPDTWVAGIKAIRDANGMKPIVQLLTSGSDLARDKVLPILEQLSYEEQYCALIGKSEELALIQVLQQAPIHMKKVAAKILGNSGKIPMQSSYFS